MTILELKDELYTELKRMLPNYANVIFRDDSGDILRWASQANSETSPNTFEQALKNYGIAIAVCDPHKRKRLDNTPCSFVRIASFPIIVAGNQLVANAPRHCNMITEVEIAITRIAGRIRTNCWTVTDSEEFTQHTCCGVVFAEHNYTK
jgi:hypothetical protein